MADDSWPPFLDRLSSDPDGAWSEFFLYACTLIKETRLQSLSRIPPSDREDAIQDFICACCASSFRRLRQYRNTGQPFRNWLITVAYNYFNTWAKRHRRLHEWEIQTPSRTDDSRPWTDGIEGAGPDPLTETMKAELKRKLNACVGSLRLECRALMRCYLLFDHDTLKVAQALRLTRDGAFYKRVEHCKEQLRAEMEEAGLQAYAPGLLHSEAERGFS